jgi:hypothetical protein
MRADTIVLPSHSEPLSDGEYRRAVQICDWAERLIAARDRYLEVHELDRAIHSPAANWAQDRGHLAGYHAIRTKCRDSLGMLRVFTQVFSGHVMGLKLGVGTRIPAAVPGDLDERVLAYLEEAASRGGSGGSIDICG